MQFPSVLTLFLTALPLAMGIPTGNNNADTNVDARAPTTNENILKQLHDTAAKSYSTCVHNCGVYAKDNPKLSKKKCIADNCKEMEETMECLLKIINKEGVSEAWKTTQYNKCYGSHLDGDY